METAGPLHYGDGYKYVTRYRWWCVTPLVGSAARIEDPDDGEPWVVLKQNGLLVIRAGYAWDGASGPTIDSKSSMRASLVHDALYQLLRAGKLSPDARAAADKLLEDLCVADGMWRWRARLWWAAVRRWAGYAAKRRAERTLVAP